MKRLSHRIRLGVNIDHIATVRQARRGIIPDPVQAALLCEKSGADHVVCHLREDRRHIQDRDVRRLLASLKTYLDLEMSLDPHIVEIAATLRPKVATLVPERRQELTTEGGLDVVSQERRIRKALERLKASGVRVSLFVDPSREQIEGCSRTGVRMIELHTGRFAAAKTILSRGRTLQQLKGAARFAHSLGLRVAAGHGLDYGNVGLITRIPEIEELNIGFSIVSRALFVGLPQAVHEMRRLIP